MLLEWKQPGFIENIVRNSYKPFLGDSEAWVKDEKDGCLRMTRTLPDDEDVVVEYKFGEYLLLMAHQRHKKSGLLVAIKRLRQSFEPALNSRHHCYFWDTDNSVDKSLLGAFYYVWGDYETIDKIINQERKKTNHSK